jgi:hypothetical protein
LLQTTTYKKTPNFFGVDYTKKGIATKVRINYTTFGSPMPGRQFNANAYKYGFNGMEKDDEVSGTGNTMTAEFWEYDTRLGKRWNIEPEMIKYAAWSTLYATQGGKHPQIVLRREWLFPVAAWAVSARMFQDRSLL